MYGEPYGGEYLGVHEAIQSAGSALWGGTMECVRAYWSTLEWEGVLVLNAAVLGAAVLDAAVLNAGCWMLDAVLDTVPAVLNDGRDSGCWTRFWMLDAVLDAAVWITVGLDTAVLNAGHDSGCWTRFWVLDATLDAGRGTGCLGTGCRNGCGIAIG